MRSASSELSDAETDAFILDLLLDEDWQRPWSEQEIARELEDPVGAADCVARLGRAGLVHRLDGFVFASRAALLGTTIVRRAGT